MVAHVFHWEIENFVVGAVVDLEFADFALDRNGLGVLLDLAVVHLQK